MTKIEIHLIDADEVALYAKFAADIEALRKRKEEERYKVQAGMQHGAMLGSDIGSIR